MSLLNDMLRDLSSRQSGQQPPEDQAELLVESRFVRDEKFPWLLTLTVFALVLVLALWILAYWFDRDAQLASSDEVKATAQAQEPPLPTQTQATVIEAIATDADKTLAKPVAEPSLEAEEAAQTTLTKLVEQWLQLGERALARDRLSAPADDNASYYFTQALQLQPENPRALAGQAAVIDRYRQLIREALLAERHERAESLLQRAQHLAPTDETLAVLQQQLAELLSVKSAPSRVAASEAVDASQQVPERKPEQEPEQRPEESSVAEASLDILPSPEWRDQQAVAAARARLQQGDSEGAITYLEDYLGRDPEAAQASARLLCHIYLEQGELAKADALLSEASNWPTTEYAQMRARWFQASGDEASARTLLEKHLADAEQDEAYRSLLARLYYTGGDYHQAVASYRRLIDAFGEKPGYWLGMALGLDALGQGSSALVAYQRSLLGGTQDAAVTNYIESRIRALSR